MTDHRTQVHVHKNTEAKHNFESQEIIKIIKNSQKTYTPKYYIDRLIGQGHFAAVFQVTNALTGEIFAMKKILLDSSSENREFQILKSIDHPNITALHHAFTETASISGEIYLNLVMDFLPESLDKVIKHYTSKNFKVPDLLIRLYSYQLIRGLGYLGQLGIIHRDIKPENLLIDTNSQVLKICDFGSAKKIHPEESSASYMCSRYYRAPELIFGSTHYTSAIDMWSAGCVIVEMVLGKPLFPGESSIDQLVEIIRVLGTPSREVIHEMNPNFNEFRFPNLRKYPWENVFGNRIGADGIDLIRKILVYSPSSRPKPYEILLHPFFDVLKQEKIRLPNGKNLPSLFDWTEEELKFSN